MSIFSFLFGRDEEPLPYKADSPQGLASRWINWAAASTLESNPISDTTGKYADRNQPKDVWFLAGCFGGSVKRTCTIPANKMIFFPAFNIWFPATRKPLRNEEIAKVSGFLYLDGIEVPLDTIATPQPFLVKGVSGNPVTRTSQSRSILVWGLWKLVAPMAPGIHEIHFGGGDGYRFQLDVIYEVRIE